MATDVELPQLGESVTEGTVTAWLVSVGDTVEADQPLFELSSDKIDTEVPSPAAGTVIEILVEVDETVEVGTVVARIGEPDEAAGDAGSGDQGDSSEGNASEGNASEGDVGDAALDAAEGEDPGSGQEELHDAGDGAGGEEELHASGEDGGGAAEGPESGAPSEAGADKPQQGGSDEAAIDIILPELGESVTEGTITAWLVSVGDEVTEDQPIFELSSDKIDTEVPSPAAGTVSEILVEVDETVDVGTVVARLGGSGGGGTQASQSSESESSESESSESSSESSSAEGSGSGGASSDGGDAEKGAAGTTSASSSSGSGTGAPAGPEALASPLVRKLAADNGIDLGDVKGTGQGGRITRDDIQGVIDGGGAPAKAEEKGQGKGQVQGKSAGAPKAKDGEKQAGKPAKSAASPAREPGDRERVEDLSRIRQRIADKMIESQSNAAQLTTIQEADVTALMNARSRHKDAFKAREGVSLSPFAMVARAAVMASRNHPMVNAYADWDNGKLYLRDYVNLGIAVDTPKGLLVPNVKGADSLTVAGLARGIAEVAQKARGEGGKKLDFSDIEGGTFTLTNTGSVGVLMDTPILNYPEVAILGVGAIAKRPAVVTAEDGTEAIAIRHMLYLSLTYDHRLLDGADAARFVTEVKHVLEGTDWEQEVG